MDQQLFTKAKGFQDQLMGVADGVWALCCGLAVRMMPCWAVLQRSICKDIMSELLH